MTLIMVFVMDALVIVCSWNMTVVIVLAWMPWSSSALEHERYYGFGMDSFPSSLEP